MSSFATPPLTALARKIAIACTTGCALASASSHATTFTETADAGQSLATAVSTTAAAGALTDIFGSLSSSVDADLYIITITNAATFSATTLNATGGFLDTQLFLFTLAGAPVVLNDDDAGGLSTLSTIPAGNLGSFAAGTYILGVSMSGYDPININGQTLFATGLTTSVRGAAFGLQPATLGGFYDGTFFSDSGSYDIQLTGATAATITGGVTPAVPEPATNAMLLVGGAALALVAKRRRAASKTA